MCWFFSILLKLGNHIQTFLLDISCFPPSVNYKICKIWAPFKCFVKFDYFQTIFCKKKFDIFFFGVFVFKFDYVIVWKNLNIKISICVFAQSTMSQSGRGAVEIMDMLFVIPFPWDNYLYEKHSKTTAKRSWK